ncbi:Tryptophan 2,3-dioxygenase (vermilion) [Micromonospora echinofusca]|uniref:Tryptophan 2,3-dioxygenase (Vermilion) n=1 Tax=Micromonospora echinofusca TaxID=47858 RepID=A0A1C5G9R2_MICEH|nr:tryptophan 2,3-dioxygenase family protein [Micromonospora echinofusca]SCG16302.1 Tryptophan 2,3-dioxygenase (vermilion) [Micromonospora echinofusca]
MRELTSWMSGAAEADDFPYSPVLAEFHRVGKHFVEKELLALLDHVRAQVTAPAPDPPTPAVRQLRDFLDVALDKWDGRYDYRSYLALRLLRLPCGADDGRDDGPGGADDEPCGADDRPGSTEAVPAGGPAAHPDRARRDRDRLLVRLVADALAFEAAAASEATDLLPEDRPGREVVAKRHRLGVRAAAPALARLGLAGAAQEPAAVLRALAADRAPAGEPALWLSMLPVYVSHDEYLFIRVLQAYECLFAGLVDELRATIAALAAGRARVAADRLAYGCQLLTAAGPLFSLLATMQPAAFRTFRQYTEGASAIQSRSYKLMESLCRTPEAARLESPAYEQVPEVRDRVHAGQPSIDEAFRAAVRAGSLTGADVDLVARAMGAFAAAVLQWRRTHHRLATRMLGPRPGTGYTEGTPYLAAVRSIPVFSSVTPDPDPSSGTGPSGGSPE